MIVNYKKLNPNAFYLLKYMNDESIRFIVLWGGSSSSKSFSVAQTILIQTLHDCENTLVMRKVGASIQKTIYEDYKVAAKALGISHLFRFKINSISCVNDAKIDFSGLDDPEKIKGISNYKRVQLEEWSEFDEADFKQIRKRLRGKKGQQIIADFNPISESHWIKKKFFDTNKWHDIPMVVEIGGKKIPEELTRVKSIKMNDVRYVLNARTKEVEEHLPDSVIIQSTYMNNFWVVGSPDGTYGYYDEQCIADFEYDKIHDPDYYNIYALGEWGVIRTGSEFFGSFNRGIHSGCYKYNSELPIHLSVDNNVLPFISISYWQIDLSKGKHIYQFHETCAESPNNTVRKSAKLCVDYLRSINYSDKIFLHGDASTKASNTFDDEKRCWMDLFVETIQNYGYEVEDHVGKSNPSVSITGEFVNAIWDGQIQDVELSIDENCTNSIEDYMSVQKDVNGGMLKAKVKNKVTQQTYEEHGHLSDNLRYLVYDVCRDEFIKFSNKRKRNLYSHAGFINFYNPSTDYQYSDRLIYSMPNINGKFVMIDACRCGKKWHLTDIVYTETTSTQYIKETLETSLSKLCIIECSDAYYQFVRELRETSNKEIRLLKEYADMDKRIAATVDYVRSYVLFSETNNSSDYIAFINNLMDYNKDADSKEASSVLSGLAQYIAKLYSD